MKIKTKLRLGFAFLFLIVIGFGGISLYHINQIALRSKVVLKDNYKSLVYVSQMRRAMDEQNGELNHLNKTEFLKALQGESDNLTEVGEQKAVADLKSNAILSLSAKGDEKLIVLQKIKATLFLIDELNMNAIVLKNNEAQKATENATLYLAVTASITFIILFSFIVNFPGFIANPLAELLAGIKEISRKNYKQRLHFTSGDEFNDIADAFNKMAIELRNWDNSNLAKIKSEKQRIETIIEQMQDAIIGLNEKQEIIFLNKVASELLQVKQGDVIGENSSVLLQKNELLKRILVTHKTDEPLKIYADEKQSYFTVEQREILIPNFVVQPDDTLIEASKFVGQVYVLKNITKFKELDEAKTNFIATVSHELKTPLSSIKMSLKLLNDDRIGKMNEEQTQLVNHIKDDSDRLLKITRELLDLSQVETGNLQLNLTKTKPMDIANFAIGSVSFQAQQKEVELHLVGDVDLPFVNADVQKTTWVMVNFLSNALRYSPAKSKIIINVGEKKNMIEFSVKDFGKGIEEQYQKRLFDRYYQVPTDGQNKSGSGLGLAISKDFIEAENGKIWVESALGEGSRFVFVLPVI